MRRRIKVSIFVLTVLLCYGGLQCWVLKSVNISDHQREISITKTNAKESSLNLLPPRNCTILAVVPSNGPTFKWEWNFHKDEFLANCSAINGCQVTRNRKKLDTADIVFVHVQMDYKKVENLLSAKSVGKQLFAYYTKEGPGNRPKKTSYNNMFDLTINFQSKSDIVVPYGRYSPLTEEDARPPVDFNYFEGKTRMVYWVVSDCSHGTRHRIETALLLEEYGVSIHTAGKCSTDFPHQDDLINISPRKEHQRKDDFWREAGKVYKFYFAAENDFAEEYITEKYWRNALDGNMIPIVQGGGNYSKLAIPGSYICVTDFDTIADLANHILKVSNDQYLYNNYFKWKQEFRKDTTLFDVEKSLLCPLSSIARNASYYLRGPIDLQKFWAYNTNYASEIAEKHRTMVLEAINITGVEMNINFQEKNRTQHT